MDFNNTPDFNDQNESQQAQPQPQVPPRPQVQPRPQVPVTPNIPDFSRAFYEPPKKKGSGWKVFWGIVITMSILANGVMLLIMLGMGFAILEGTSVSGNDGIVETVLMDGARDRKIAVINLQGVIDGQMSNWVGQQIDHAEADSNVRAIILRIDSPGGEVGASDQIHYYISRFKNRTRKPVLAFMQSVAASGGYYAAVSCDQIMAEPTVITGSIGVIMNHMVIKDLLTEKLGIEPVTLKSGRRKDWPSMYTESSDEEKQYLMDRIVMPAYERFVQLVAEGRKKVLTEDEVRVLADGGIYSAPEALEEKLIDAIGYFDDAVLKAQQMAQISGVRVVTYQQEFSLFSILGVRSQGINIDAEILEKLAAPRILYMWDGKR